MTALTLQLVRLVEELVDKKVAGRLTAWGTVVSVEATLLRAAVTFDGSTVPVPVRMHGHVRAAAGDRVTLVRYGSDWVIDGAMAVRWPGVAVINTDSTTGTTTSSTFTALPGTPATTFTKVWNDSGALAIVATSCDSDTASTAVQIGIEVGSTTFSGAKRFFSAAGVRGLVGSIIDLPPFDAGEYPVEIHWRRDSGAGTLRQFAGGDWVAAVLLETGP